MTTTDNSMEYNKQLVNQLQAENRLSADLPVKVEAHAKTMIHIMTYDADSISIAAKTLKEKRELSSMHSHLHYRERIVNSDGRSKREFASVRNRLFILIANNEQREGDFLNGHHNCPLFSSVE